MNSRFIFERQDSNHTTKNNNTFINKFNLSDANACVDKVVAKERMGSFQMNEL